MINIFHPKEILSDPCVTDRIEKAKEFLSQALKAGVQKGRLKQGLPGKKGSHSYFTVSKTQRREVLTKYKKNKRLVEHKDVDVAKEKNKVDILSLMNGCYGLIHENSLCDV